MKRQWKKSRWAHIFRKNGERAFFNAKNLKTLYGDRDSLLILNSFFKPIVIPKVLSKYKNKQEAEKIVLRVFSWLLVAFEGVFSGIGPFLARQDYLFEEIVS